MESLLKVNDLYVSYGPIKALRGISIEVPKGSIIAILGSNGAGKSTLLKSLTGLIPSESGTVHYQGRDITKSSVERITADGISHVPEGREIFNDLTVYENLKIGAFTIKATSLPPEAVHASIRKRVGSSRITKHGDDEQLRLNKHEVYENNLARVYELFPVLKERTNQLASTLSGGEMQMLAIGRALMGTPTLLVLDEPSLGLAPLIVKRIFEVIKQLNGYGISVLLVEQNALQALKIADYAYVLQVGEIVKKGVAKVLANDRELIEAYLGK